VKVALPQGGLSMTYDDNPLGWLAHGRIAGGRWLLGQATCFD